MSGITKPSRVGPIWALTHPPLQQPDGSVHLTFTKPGPPADARPRFETIILDNEDMDHIADALGLKRITGDEK